MTFSMPKKGWPTLKIPKFCPFRVHFIISVTRKNVDFCSVNVDIYIYT